MKIAKNEWRLGSILQRRAMRMLVTTALAVGLAPMIAATSNTGVAAAIPCVGGPIVPAPTDASSIGGSEAGGEDSTTDTQGCVEPTQIRVYANLPDGRGGPDDQFTIGIRPTERPLSDTMTATTVGSESGSQTEMDAATGISEYLGPIVTEPGLGYTMSQTGAVGSATDLAGYVTTWECIDPNGVFDRVVGTGTEAAVTTPAAGGADIVCTFTSAPTGAIGVASEESLLVAEAGMPATDQAGEPPIEPTLTVAMTSDPAPGAKVAAGEEVEYTLVFDNSSGGASAEVDMVDWLVDVLDDATVTVDPTVVTGEGLSVSAPADGIFTVTGTLAPGSTATATFTVRVNPDRQRGDDRLVNHLVRPGDAIDGCAGAQPSCNEHLVVQPDLVVRNTSNPVSGAGLIAGDQVDYTLTFDNSVGTARAVVEYLVDLEDVVDDATVTSAPALTTGEGLTVSGVDDGLFMVTGELDAGAAATVAYSAAVRPEEERGNDLLIGFLLDAERVKGDCVAGDSTCTRHPIPGIELVTAISDIVDVDDDGSTSVGDIINYAHTVTNTGTDDLFDVGLADVSSPGEPLSCPANDLAVGETMVCSGRSRHITDSDASAGSLDSTVVVSAVDEHGTAVADTATATVVIAATPPSSPLPITGWPAARALSLAAVYLFALGAALVTVARSRRRSDR